ncbi:MAG: hypothetical protein ACYST6_06815 [Planctomycetota bacterium]
MEDILGSQGEAEQVGELTHRTLENVRNRFSNIYRDTGVQAAFGYLVSLATASLPGATGFSSPETGLEGNPSPVRIAKNLSDWVRVHAASQEYAELASRAAADAIADWTRSCSAQGLLFDVGHSASRIWAEAASAEGFCQVSRSFFARFTERYLRYFLEREASAQLSSLEARQRFATSLHEHIQGISRQAFQTSKITQSFAAGWFNKHARESRPSDWEMRGFLARAFGKLQEEMGREVPK